MELLGADYCEHEVFHPGVGVTRAVSVLQHVPKFTSKVLRERQSLETSWKLHQIVEFN